MVAGRDKTGMPACMLRAAWRTWLGPRASPVDRSVIGSAPDDVLSPDPGRRTSKIGVQCSVFQPKVCASLCCVPAFDLATQFTVLWPAVLHSTVLYYNTREDVRPDSHEPWFLHLCQTSPRHAGQKKCN